MSRYSQTTTNPIKCKQETHETHPHASNITFTRQTVLNKGLLTRYVLSCRVCLKGLGLSRGVPDFCSSARNVKYPSNSNLRGFRSNQVVRGINNIRMKLLIELFDRRNQNIGKKLTSSKIVKILLGLARGVTDFAVNAQS